MRLKKEWLAAFSIIVIFLGLIYGVSYRKKKKCLFIQNFQTVL